MTDHLEEAIKASDALKEHISELINQDRREPVESRRDIYGLLYTALHAAVSAHSHLDAVEETLLNEAGSNE